MLNTPQFTLGFGAANHHQWNNIAVNSVVCQQLYGNVLKIQNLVPHSEKQLKRASIQTVQYTMACKDSQIGH